MADNDKFSRHASLLNQLYVSGRHNALTEITSVQAYRALSRITRVNSRQLFFFKMRNCKEIATMVEELSAMLINRKMLADAKNIAEAKRLLLEIYNEATSEPYRFLYCNLTKRDIDEVFMKKLHIVYKLPTAMINNINQKILLIIRPKMGCNNVDE